ncbi:MAG: hypothetical protein GWO87_02180 [Xanthomonadaceae bacterium]|nr:hypothetical protein [Rhodospirillaceae bacterium]NIA17976.1 hypothetical protein [Xanthomonadaceae bacterium]
MYYFFDKKNKNSIIKVINHKIKFMLSNVKVPIYKMPAERAIKIIEKSSGKPIREIKKFYKGINTHEIRKLKSNSPYTTFSRKEVKQLLRDTHKKGLFLSEKKIKKEFDIISQEETKRKIEYSKGRTKLMERMENLKSGEDPILSREIDRTVDKRAKSIKERKGRRVDRIRDMVLKTSLGKQKENKIQDNTTKNKDQTDNKNYDNIDNIQSKTNIKEKNLFHKKDIIDL